MCDPWGSNLVLHAFSDKTSPLHTLIKINYIMSKQKQLLPTNHIASHLKECCKQVFGIDFEPERFRNKTEEDYLYSNGLQVELEYDFLYNGEHFIYHHPVRKIGPFWMPVKEYLEIKKFIESSIINETSCIFIGYIPNDSDTSKYEMWAEIGTLKV